MNRPVWVLASDIEYYVCKYNRISPVAYRLYKEYLGASFSKRFELSVPDTAFVQVDKEHLSDGLGIHKKHFIQPCFGSKQLPNSNEVDKHNIGQLARAANRKKLRHDLLRISFFDIWLANEDRSHNNYNLLFTVENGLYHLHVIDHEACFNHGEFPEAQLTAITYEESLIYSDLYVALFSGKRFLKTIKIDALKEYYYICMQNCKKALPEILSIIPPQWNINIPGERHKLETYLLTDEWFEEAWKNFIQFLQLAPL